MSLARVTFFVMLLALLLSGPRVSSGAGAAETGAAKPEAAEAEAAKTEALKAVTPRAPAF